MADIFYQFHRQALLITDEECLRYGISRQDADEIVAVIRGFAEELYNQKVNCTLLGAEKEFPLEAMKYRKRLT